MHVTVDGVVLHDMPEQRLAADLDKRFGAYMGLFDEPRAFAACKNCDFHKYPP